MCIQALAQKDALNSTEPGSRERRLAQEEIASIDNELRRPAEHMV